MVINFKWDRVRLSVFGVSSDTNWFYLLISFLELNYKSFYQFVTQKLRMPSMDQQRQDLRDALAVFDTSDTGQSNAFYSQHRINNSRIPVQAKTYSLRTKKIFGITMKSLNSSTFILKA